MSRFSNKTCLVVVVLILGAARGRGADGVDPRSLLSRLPTNTSQDVYIFDGAIKRSAGVDRWRLSLNDGVIFESSSPASRSVTAIRVALILRTGDNLIVLESLSGVDADATVVGQWTTHVSRRADRPAEQFVALVQGQMGASIDRSPLEAFEQSLIAIGIPETHIRSASSWQEVSTILGDFGKEANAKDQVLIYYLGLGRVSRVSMEPLLLFPNAKSSIDSWPVSDLIREAPDLPSVSALLDISYEPTAQRAGDLPLGGLRQPVTAPGAPWLRMLTPGQSVEVTYTNPFTATSGWIAEGYTGDFVRELASADAGPNACKTFAMVAQALMATAYTQRKAPVWPVFFTKGSSSFRFCRPAPENVSRRLAVELVPPVDADPPLRFADLPAGIRADMTLGSTEVTVDGIPVVRQTRSPQVRRSDGASPGFRLPLGLGSHLIEVTTSRQGGSFSVGSGAVDVAGAGTVVLKASDRLKATIQSPVRNSVTSDVSANLGFLVGDLDGDRIRYEVRNNGVVVLQEVVRNAPTLGRLQAVRQIPLVIGVNNVVLEVRQGGRFRSARTTVVRRQAQSVRAVIVGVDAPAGAVPLSGATADAQMMKDLLLRYTDAVPNQILLLTGANATRQAVIDAITELNRNSSSDPFSLSQGSSDVFLLYFAGYGLTIEDADTSQPTRCLLPSDFDPDRAKATCMSTTELDTLLDSAGKSLVIVDTSYDGLSSGDASTGGAALGRSRTYRDFLTADTTWRLSSGTDRPDRAFLVASGSNSPAMETSDGRHGLFTLAFDNAIRHQLEKDTKGTQELSLLDAYNLAHDDTSARSNRHQIPVMKGVLSTPFVFVRNPQVDLKDEASGLSRAVRDDVTAMRRLDPVHVARAADLYDKILSLNDHDVEAQQGRARMLLLKGDVESARQVVDEAAQRWPALDAKNAAEWLVIRAELEMRTGDLNAAIADSEQAVKHDPQSPGPTAFLGMLYGATSQPDKSLAQLQPLLAMSERLRNDRSLTDEEWGRIILHTYLSLRRVGRRSDAHLLLESYAESYQGENYLKLVYRNRFVRKWLPHQSSVVAMGEVGVQAPWPHVVAEFMRQRRKYEKQLYSFRGDVASYDPRDETAFECMLHFYVGMAETLDKNPERAKEEFQRVVATGKTEYIEYWIAKAELDNNAG